MNTDLLDPTIFDAIDPETLELWETDTEAAACPAVIPLRPEAVPLWEVLLMIRRDSRREPQQYLDETVVPHGGE